MKQKFLQILALLALVVVPWTGQAQSGCTIRVAGEDSYGDGWNGGSLDIIQGTDTLANFALTGSSGELNVVLPTDDPVSFVWNSGSYGYEVTVYIYDGGNTLAHSVNNPAAGTIYTMSSPCPSCLPATQLTASDVTTDGFTLTWTASSTATSYAVYLDGSLVTDGVTSTSYTFSGLNANTLYNVGVQAVCSASDSANIVSRDVRTSCGLTVLPYSTGFEDAAFNGAWYPCWDSTIHAGTDPSVNNVSVHTGTYSMYLQATSSESYNLVVGPEMDATGDNIYVRFWANMNGGGWLKAGVITDATDTSTFIPLVTIENVSGWNEYEFNTAALDPTATYRVAWLGYRSVSYNQRIASIDDIYISEIPSCLRVTDLAVVDSLTDSTSLTISWVDPNAGASFTVRYWAATGDTVEMAGITDTFYTATELTANTQYYFEVVVNCGSEDAEAMATSGRTACGSLVIPFAEGFEDEGALSCWQVINPAYNTGRSTNAASTGSASFLFYYTTNPPEYLISPVIANADEGVTVEFQYKRYSSSYNESFQVGYSTTGDSVEAFTWEAETTDANEAFQLYSTTFPAGTKYVAIKYTAYDAYGLYIDDINLQQPADCAPVSMLTFDTATATTATIHWTAGEGQSAWYVRVGADLYDAYDTSYTITGLSAMTEYTAMVAANCGGDSSAWRSVSFRTGCSGEMCEISVTSNDSYDYGYYAPTLHVVQNGVELASVNGYTETVGVCSDMPVLILYEAPSYSYGAEPTATIVDGGDAELFNGVTTAFSTGDTLLNILAPCPTCITPSGVTVTTVDSSMITFTWPTEAGYTYLTSFNGGAYSVNNTGVQTQYNLEANTVYTFSVKVVCSEGDTSNARTISQRTACSQMIIPYVQDFESDSTDEVPSCWNAVSGTATVNDYYAHGGTRSLRMAGGDMIASSAIPLQGDSIYVSFWSSIDYSGTIEAGVMTNPLYDSTFVTMVSVPAGNGYEFFEFNTSTLSADSTYYLAFRFNGSYSSASIDDITIDRYSGCMTPSSLMATPDSVTSEVVLDWVNNGTTSEFVIEYREVGGDWSAPIYAPGVTSYSLTSLSYATNYEIRVGLVCGTDTLWTMTSVMTACQAYSLPYFENFYSADGTLPPCWDVSNASVIKYDNWPNANGNGALQGGHYSAGEYALVPRLSMPIAKLEMSFDAKVGNIEEGDGMMIGVYSSLTGTVEWTDTLQVVGQCRENYVRFTCNFLDYTGTGDRIAISHSHNNPSDWGFYVDSLIIVALPECNPPENLTAHNTMYPSTADDIYFTWTVNNEGTIPSSYQLYIDTITSTVAVDSVPDSLLISVDTNYYMPPINTLAEGAHYRLFVRSSCGTSLHSNWVELQNGFATDEYWMNNTGVADTIVGCDFIIYDNGGPVAGYLHNSNSALVIQAGEPGRELQIQGAFINTGDDQSTFTVYDGIGVNDSAVLYTRSLSMAHDQFDYLDSVLATSTNGALTITFTSGYSAALGYELYVHCVGDASCEKPSNLQVEMVGEGQAYATWNSTGASLYRVYHHANGDSVWNMQPTTTNSITLSGLPADVTYDFYVVAYCSATDTSAPSIIRHFSTHYDAPVCDTITDLTVSNIGQTSATLEWTSDGTLWEVEFNGTVISTPDNPCTLSGLTVGTDYSVRVRNVCDASADFYSEWSAAVSFRTDTIPVEPQGIDDVNGTAAVALYPNPASTTVTIAVRGISGTATVTLVDLNGRTCGSWKAEDGQLVVDLGGMARGAYFVRVTGENTSVVRKLVLR